jgi:hypothetical protein
MRSAGATALQVVYPHQKTILEEALRRFVGSKSVGRTKTIIRQRQHTILTAIHNRFLRYRRFSMAAKEMSGRNLSNRRHGRWRLMKITITTVRMTSREGCPHQRRAVHRWLDHHHQRRRNKRRHHEFEVDSGGRWTRHSTDVAYSSLIQTAGSVFCTAWQ